MTYEQLHIHIREEKYVRFNRNVVLSQVHDLLKGAVERKLLKEKQQVIVWVKGYPESKLIMHTPKL